MSHLRLFVIFLGNIIAGFSCPHRNVFLTHCAEEAVACDGGFHAVVQEYAVYRAAVFFGVTARSGLRKE